MGLDSPSLPQADRRASSRAAAVVQRLLGTPRRVTITVALGWTLAIAVISHGDVRALLLLGREFSHPASLSGAPVFAGTGYDGQFYAALATDPLALDADTPRHLDAPRYRAGRIGLSLLAWLLAGGNGPVAVLLYQLLCWTGAILGVWVAARWLEEEGGSPLWALPLGGSAAVAASSLRSLPDAAAASLVMMGLWLHRRANRGAIGVLALACLVRETSLVAVAALALHELQNRRFKLAVAGALVPVAVLVAWRAWVASRPGMGGTLGFGNLDWPMVGIWDKLRRPVAPIEVIGTVALTVAILAAAAIRPPWSPVALAYGGYALMAACLAYSVVEEVYAYSRVTAIMPLAACVLAARGRSIAGRWALRLVPIAYAALGGAVTVASYRLMRVLMAGR